MTAEQLAAGGRLPKVQEKILAALAQHGPMPKPRLALITGYRVAGGFNNGMSSLRTAGWIEGSSHRIEITDAGREAIGDPEPLPTGSQLLEYWKAHHFSKAERLIVDVLAEHYPDPLDRTQLAHAAGYQVAGGFNNALSHLRTGGVITGKGQITLDPTFVDVP